MRAEFENRVIDPFIEAYSKGRTPNPCILCNRHIKFPFLLKIAKERGFDAIATGHYARIKCRNALSVMGNEPLLPRPPLAEWGDIVTRRSSLLKGVDPGKDQSYVLYGLRHEELDRLVLPLGDLRKAQVRAMAGRLGLPSGDRLESQEICFVEGKKYYQLMEGISHKEEGPIIDIESGKVLGSHGGIYRYTIGQRKRLGVATGRPLYVVKIDHEKSAIYVGPKELAMMREFLVEEIIWLMDPDEYEEVASPTHYAPRIAHHEFRASVKVRSTMKDEPATVRLIDGGRAKVIYDESQWAPAPGQSAVFYKGDTVIGGGVIV